MKNPGASSGVCTSFSNQNALHQAALAHCAPLLPGDMTALLANIPGDAKVFALLMR
jgi:hypothetical protein